MKSCFILILAALTCVVSPDARAEPNWDRALARQEVSRMDSQAVLKPLFQLARSGQNDALIAALDAIRRNPDLSAPQKDYLHHRFALNLGDLDPNAVSEAVLEYLSTYEPGTRVMFEDLPRHAVPMFNVRSAAAGARNRWDRMEGTDKSVRMLSGSPDHWLDAYLAAGPAARRGYVDALDTATRSQLGQLGRAALSRLESNPELTMVAARAGLDSGDMNVLRQSVALGSGPGVSNALRMASRRLDDKQAVALLNHAIEHGSETAAGLAIAHLAPSRLDSLAVVESLFSALESDNLKAGAAMVLGASEDPEVRSRLEASGVSTTLSSHDRIVEWVENAPVSDTDKIALGYPVPIPVDTPMPFDGFRSYNGLHTRHQELAENSPFSHPIEIGETVEGRTIWAYQLGDADRVTAAGLPEHAMLTNGTIHAREWASPEVTTGIIELLAQADQDDFLLGYLRENANIVVIPVLNIDGFIQTQRYPAPNWLGTDIDDPDESPRDGRMRRKNMLGVDTVLETEDDHLLGVDLNRNNPPFWNTDPDRSSGIPSSIVYHGAAAHSEPETQALAAAAAAGPENRLTMYTDVHSYSQVHFWVRTSNDSLTDLTQRLLTTFTNHHYAFDLAKYYWFEDNPQNLPVASGIGSTDEYFTRTYLIPGWTLEIEPTFGNHPEWPGQGADYGGLARNGHDGFILPDSEVERVRTDLAETFAVTYYQQAGPPSIAAVRFIDEATGAVVFESEWDVSGETTRERWSYEAQPLQLGREYLFWLAFDKPMRWREGGEVAPLPGQPGSTLDFDPALVLGEELLSVIPGEGDWLDQPGDAPGGYLRYRDDALAAVFSLPRDEINENLVQGKVWPTLAISTTDMTGSQTDADPATVARWENGGWVGYEDTDGQDGTNTGGFDHTTLIPLTSEDLGDPFVIVPGTSSAWFDPDRNGEGFMLEILSETTAVMYWFTYNLEGGQDWYVAQGEIRGNRIVFPELIQVSGGEFGPGWDNASVINNVVGSASFIWKECDLGAMDWRIDQDGNGLREGRMNLLRITRIMGLPCGTPQPGAPITEAARWSGSWYDVTHTGEGYVLEILIDQSALVYWFSFDPDGNRRWFFGNGVIDGDSLTFENMLTTSGPIFGPEYRPDILDIQLWGSLELELQCDSGTARFEPTEDGFPAGMLDLTRLTYLATLSCGD